MFNVRLKLRKQRSFVVPTGPNFFFSKSRSINVDDTLIKFRAPKHRGRRANDKPEYITSNPGIRFRETYSEDKAEFGLPDEWERAMVFYHSWAFCGPWFMGAVGSLDMIASLMRLRKHPDGLSFFHPRALEKSIGDNLADLYAYHFDETRNNIQTFQTPVNWQPLPDFPVIAAKLEVVSEKFSPHRTIDHIVYFPIADDILVRVVFSPTRYLNLPRAELDKRVAIEPLHDLMNKIIDSIEVELSPVAKAQQTAAVKGLKDAALVENYPPIKWDNLSDDERRQIREQYA